LSASAALLLLCENKTKSSDEYALYLALFLIVLNVKLCWYLWLLIHKCCRRDANLQNS